MVSHSELSHILIGVVSFLVASLDSSIRIACIADRVLEHAGQVGEELRNDQKSKANVDHQRVLDV